MTRKVSLEWLAKSEAELPKEFRTAIDNFATDTLRRDSKLVNKDCCICAMFFEDIYQDSEGNEGECHFEELGEDDIPHFQQMAKHHGFDIKIVQIELLPEEHRTLKADLEPFVVS